MIRLPTRHRRPLQRTIMLTLEISHHRRGLLQSIHPRQGIIRDNIRRRLAPHPLRSLLMPIHRHPDRVQVHRRIHPRDGELKTS